jgi:predicted Zn-ribbon and HTH transcriptional regulator
LGGLFGWVEGEKMIESYWFFQPSERKLSDFESPYQPVNSRKIALPIGIPFATKMANGELFPYPPETVTYIPIIVGDIQYPFLAIWFRDGDWGKYPYPTPQMLQEIIAIIGENSVPSFWKWHNKCLFKHSELLAQGEIFFTNIYSASYDICKKIKFPYDTYYYYKLLLYYGNSLFDEGDYSIKKQMERNREYASALNIFLQSGKQPSNPIDVRKIQEKWLSKITDYSRARTVLDLYQNRLLSVSNVAEIKKLINQREQEKQKNIQQVKRNKDKNARGQPLKPPAVCRFCGAFIEQVTRFPSSCGSDECKRRYEEIRKAQKRGTQLRSEIKDLISKRGNGIRCRQCRRQKKILYTEQLLCEVCFRAKN